MQFFCPVCQVSGDIQPETTITTKLGQIAYKAHCLTCKQDLSAIEPAKELPIVTLP